MYRSKYDEPVGNTCPTIDNIKRQLNYSMESINKAIDLLDFDMLPNGSQIKDFLESALGYSENDYQLEELREANQALRDWGRNMASEAQDFDKEIDSLKSQIKDLQEDKDDLERENSRLNECIINY